MAKLLPSVPHGCQESSGPATAAPGFAVGNPASAKGLSGDEAAAFPRFLVDAMLGNVARELRLLGYDAEYAGRKDDAALLRRCQADGRVLVTRDRALARRARGIRCYYVSSARAGEQTPELLRALGAERVPGVLSRCAECNTVLEELPAEEARGRVPDHVASTIGSYLHCPGCERVYWRGSHLESIEQRVRCLLGRAA